MSTPYSGGCACGQVKIAIADEPLLVRQCWCRHCQQLAAGSATTNAVFAAETITVEGDVAWNSHIADSGNTLNFGFCAKCGSQLIGWSSARPQMRVVRVGALDQPHGLKPTQVIWTAQAPEWAVWDAAMEQHEGQPPAPVVKPA